MGEPMSAEDLTRLRSLVSEQYSLTPEEGIDLVAEVDRLRERGSYKRAQAEAWAEGVETALNHAKRDENGITLSLVTWGGTPWPNPYLDVESMVVTAAEAEQIVRLLGQEG